MAAQRRERRRATGAPPRAARRPRPDWIWNGSPECDRAHRIGHVAAAGLALCMDDFHLWRAFELGGGDNCRISSPRWRARPARSRTRSAASDEVYRATFDELERLVGEVVSRIAAEGGGV